MSEENPRLVARGWFLGLGLIAPVCLATILADQVSSYIYQATDGNEMADFGNDHSRNISIDEFRDIVSGNKVLVLGVMSNKGEKPLNSITLEAEFFDEKGEFVYERSEYISMTLDPGEKENFQIECGCKDKEFPRYKTVTVRATSASAY